MTAVTFSVFMNNNGLTIRGGIVGFLLNQLEGEMLVIWHTTLTSRQWQVAKRKCPQRPQETR